VPAYRYFTDHSISEHQPIILEGQELHHLARVMRATPGETVELVNGQGQLALAQVTSVEKRTATLHVEEVKTVPPPTFEVIIAQAMPRPNRLDTILEKGTELGMTQLWLFPGKLSEKKEVTEKQLQRMRIVTIAAMKQCGRPYLPKICIKPPLIKWQKPEYNLFYGDVSPTAPLFSEAWESAQGHGLVFFIGPESGFSDDETATLEQLGAKGVKLHPNILRTDTAPLAALSLIQHWLMQKAP